LDSLWNEQINPEMMDINDKFNFVISEAMQTPRMENTGHVVDMESMALENIFEKDLTHKANTIKYWYLAQKKRLCKVQK
jgi:hypothetical protein